MIDFFKKYRIEIFIFCLTVFIRMTYAFSIQSFFGEDVFLSYSDAFIYEVLAKNMVSSGVFSEALVAPELVPDAMRTPGYPIFLAIFEYLNVPRILIIFAQNILAGIIAVLIYRLSLGMFNSHLSGIIASAFYAFDPTAIYWTNLLMSDQFAGFFFILTVYLFWKKKYAWSGVALGITALIRPIFLYLAPIFLLAFIFIDIEKSKKIKALFFTFSFLVVVFPWMLRNYFLFGSWQLSSNGWMAIHFFTSSEFASKYGITHTWPETPEDFYNVSGADETGIVGSTIGPKRQTLYYYEFSNQPFYKKYFFNLVRAHPFDFTVFSLKSSFKTFIKADYDYLMNHVLLPEAPWVKPIVRPFIIFSYTLWYLILALAVVPIFYKKHRFWTVFILSFPVLNALLTGAIGDGSSQGRYNLPFLPFFLLLGAAGVYELWLRFQSRIGSTN